MKYTGYNINGHRVDDFSNDSGSYHSIYTDLDIGGNDRRGDGSHGSRSNGHHYGGNYSSGSYSPIWSFLSVAIGFFAFVGIVTVAIVLICAFF